MELQLLESKHPDARAQHHYDSLIAIEEQKKTLLNTLSFFFNTDKIDKWHKNHHYSKLSFLGNIIEGTPLMILAGDVGCGKTALAQSIATPLGKLLDKRVLCFETPSNIRGGGRVGEISNRITEAFTQAKAKVKGENVGILIIDEADDLATDREQSQAHHEDRSGLNVLIKQIDSISKDKTKLAVILITNRLKALDPAVVRRATQVILFNRPDKGGRKRVFQYLLSGTNATEKEIEELTQASDRGDKAYSFSDLVQKIGKQALIQAIQEDRPFNKTLLLEVLTKVEPSPSIK
ncbi:AAA family ATPase [Rhodocytophaga rosea]|uniref:AAA family ATPase n=1 Tax=Rhodocytophaga rosea TaxID=2704465 RepID=A0A6C0GE44_9BACT|nr:ATP-binding protein [Rhodocytophaga rosea]QHT66241.1 AAA family ATPase [Rhodocytophaga rosea]